jgi:hypothetical protein
MPRRTVRDWLVHTRTHFWDVGTMSARPGTQVSAVVRCPNDVPGGVLVVGVVCAALHAVATNVTAMQASQRDLRTGVMLP